MRFPVSSRFWQSCRIALLAIMLACLGAGAGSFSLDTARLQQTMRAKYGDRGVQAMEAWFAMLANQRQQPEAQQLRAVNDFWNTMVLGSDDMRVWGQTDYWATPLESLGQRAGDCEDFVIGKYFSLVHLGVAPEKLRFIYVRARIGGMGSSDSIAHMVLGYYATPGAEPLVLDNMAGTILPASQRPDLTPVFTFNAQGVYVTGAATASIDRISRWGDLLRRMRQEGFQP